MLIDINKQEVKDSPIFNILKNHHGDVLLENSENGVVIVPAARFKAAQLMTSDERILNGWDKYADLLNSIQINE